MPDRLVFQDQNTLFAEGTCTVYVHRLMILAQTAKFFLLDLILILTPIIFS